MRLLFVSNYYPPHVRGGYEQWCHEVATELVRRGHSVAVLTSVAEVQQEELCPDACDGSLQVHRVLNLEVEAGIVRSTVRILDGTRLKRERENLDSVRRVVTTFQPDAALIWGMWNIARSVPALLEHLLGRRVAFYLCDYWPSLPSAYVQQWQAPARHSVVGLPKRLLGPAVVAQLAREPQARLRLERPICVSRAVRDVLVREGVPIQHAKVIYGGTRIHEFSTQRRQPGSRHSEGLRVLYAGRLTATKGVHTAILALGRLAERGEDQLTLDIVGNGDEDYIATLRELVRGHHLEERVRFRPGVPRAEMPRIMAEHDALVLLSEWEEPFARIVLEAMAAGLVVVGSLTGGTGEVLVENETGLTFQRGDANGLATQLQRLMRDPQLLEALSEAGRRCVEERFTFRRMVDQLEAALGCLPGEHPRA